MASANSDFRGKDDKPVIRSVVGRTDDTYEEDMAELVSYAEDVFQSQLK